MAERRQELPDQHIAGGHIADAPHEMEGGSLFQIDLKAVRRQLRRDQLEQARVHLETRQVDGRHAKLPCEHAHDVRFGHQTHLDDGQPDSLAWRGRLLLQRLCQLLTTQ